MMSSSARNKEIHTAVINGDIYKTKRILSQGASVNSLDSNGNTPLMNALIAPLQKKKKGEIIDLLLSCDSDVKAVNYQGDSCLHLAVKASMRKKMPKKFILRLLDHGAEANLSNFRGRTAYQLAYEIGNAELGDALLLYDRTNRKRKERACGKSENLVEFGSLQTENPGTMENDPIPKYGKMDTDGKEGLLQREKSTVNEEIKSLKSPENHVDSELERRIQRRSFSSHKAKGSRNRIRQLMSDIVRCIFPTTSLMSHLGSDLTNLESEERSKSSKDCADKTSENQCEKDVVAVGANNLYQGTFQTIPPVLLLMEKGNEYATLKSLSVNKEMVSRVEETLGLRKSVDDTFPNLTDEICRQAYSVR